MFCLCKSLCLCFILWGHDRSTSMECRVEVEDRLHRIYMCSYYIDRCWLNYYQPGFAGQNSRRRRRNRVASLGCDVDPREPGLLLLHSRGRSYRRLQKGPS
ncbi:hypothetical protein F4814DRAFT_419433 [Daldinia grandis]|nr:hypothetical protein F4814DRAFT_419433 [Daldinia grandis]